MNKLTTDKRVRVIAALVEGCSIRATVRMTGVAKNTIVKLLAELGEACAKYQDRVMRDLSCKYLQCDEIWSFCYAKKKNVPDHKQGLLGYGDVWTWFAIDADTKLIPCWLVGSRDYDYAKAFIADLASRLANRVQLTTDGHKPYVKAVDRAFGENVDYAVLVKLYGHDNADYVRYSQPECIGCKATSMTGSPDADHISTSFAERANLTTRMGMRRFTRLTNAFSKKLENHEHAVAIHFMHYNFCRVHTTIKTTPAMAAGVADKKWTIEDMLSLLSN